MVFLTMLMCKMCIGTVEEYARCVVMCFHTCMLCTCLCVLYMLRNCFVLLLLHNKVVCAAFFLYKAVV